MPRLVLLTFTALFLLFATTTLISAAPQEYKGMKPGATYISDSECVSVGVWPLKKRYCVEVTLAVELDESGKRFLSVAVNKDAHYRGSLHASCDDSCDLTEAVTTRLEAERPEYKDTVKDFSITFDAEKNQFKATADIEYKVAGIKVLSKKLDIEMKYVGTEGSDL